MMTDREEELARLLLLEQQHGELNDADRNRLIALSERIPDKEEELLRTMATLGQAPPLPAPVTPPTAVQAPPLPAPVTPQKPVSAGRPTFTRRRLIGAGIGVATAGAVWFALSGNEPVAQALEQPPGFPPESSPPLPATPSGYGSVNAVSADIRPDDKPNLVDIAKMIAKIGPMPPVLAKPESIETGTTYESGPDKLTQVKWANHSSVTQLSEILSLADSVYVGQILQGQSLKDTMPATLSVTEDKRAKLRVSVLGSVARQNEKGELIVRHEAVVPNMANIEAIRQKLTHTSLDVPSVWSHTITHGYNREHLSAKAGIKVNFLESVHASVNASQTEERATCLMLLRQNAYKLAIDMPRAIELFTPETTLKDFGNDGNGLAMNNPPVLVTEVEYGRVIAVLVESSSNVSEIEAALSASLAGAFKVDANANQLQVLKNAKISVTVHGGRKGDVNLIDKAQLPTQVFDNNFSAFLAHMQTQMNPNQFDPQYAKPIAFVARNLADGRVAALAAASAHRLERRTDPKPYQYAIRIDSMLIKDSFRAAVFGIFPEDGEFRLKLNGSPHPFFSPKLSRKEHAFMHHSPSVESKRNGQILLQLFERNDLKGEFRTEPLDLEALRKDGPRSFDAAMNAGNRVRFTVMAVNPFGN